MEMWSKSSAVICEKVVVDDDDVLDDIIVVLLTENVEDDEAKKEVNVSSSGRGTDTTRDDTLAMEPFLTNPCG